MAVELATGYVSIVPSARNFGKNLGKEIVSPLERSGRDAGKKAAAGVSSRFRLGLKDVAKIAAGAFIARGAIAGIRLLGREMKSFVTEARESAKIGRLTNAVVKSTGGIANVTGKQIGDLATKLSNLSGIDDEVIQSGENVLLTFTNIRNTVGKGNDIFDRATGAALNLSAALGQDMKSSVIQVGKALNDPIKGVTALRRVGVSFTAQQVDQIKVLVASGKTLQAQKLILGELGTEFGGAAAAAADPMARLSVIVGNFKEQLGGALLPAIGQIADQLGTLLPFLAAALAPIISTLLPALVGAFSTILPALTPIITAIAQTLGPILQRVGTTLADVFSAVGPILSKLAPTLGLLASLFLGMVDSLTPLLPPIGLLLRVFGQLANTILKALAPVLKTLVAAVTPIISMFGKLLESLFGTDEAAGPVVRVFKILGSAVNRIFKALAPVLPLFGKLITDVIRQLAPTLPVIAEALAAVAVALGRALASALKAILPALTTIAVILAKSFGKVLRTLAPIIVKLANVVSKLLTKAFDSLAPILDEVASVLATVLSDAISELAPILPRLADAFIQILTALLPLLPSLLKLAVSLLPPILQIITALLPAVTTLANLLAEGIVVAVQILTPILNVLVGALTGIIGAVTNLGDTFSTVFDFLKGKWPLLLAIITGPIGLAVLFIVKNWDTLKQATVTVWNGIKTAVLTPFNAIKDGITSAILILKDVWDTFWGGLAAVIDTEVKLIKTAINGVLGAIQAVYDGFRKVWNAIEVEIPKVHIPGTDIDIGGGTLGLPDLPSVKIPRLAGGGVLTEPTLALLAETAKSRPEIAAPESLLRKIFADELGKNRGKLADTVVINRVKDSDDTVKKLSWAAKTRGF